MEVYSATRLTDAWERGGIKGIAFDRDGKEVRVEAEEVLFALGRIPNTEPLDLVQAGVETSQHTIITNELMQTSMPHIYAVGDCTGPYEIVHIAIQQGEVAAHNIAHPEAPKSMDYRLLDQYRFYRTPGCHSGTDRENGHAASYSLPLGQLSFQRPRQIARSWRQRTVL